jgi:ribosome-associated toxin RatA of RatAB toxin-antitoxin module
MSSPQQTSDSQVAPAAGIPRRGLKRRVFALMMALGGLAIGWMWYKGSTIDERLFEAADLRRGMRSQIIGWPGGRTAVQISRYVDLEADLLWNVVTDQARFDEFMPYVRQTTVRPGPDGSLIEAQILDLPHASYELELQIRLETKGNKRQARWTQTSGALRFNEGAWVVERVPTGGSLLRYQVSASAGVIPQWFVNFAMTKRLGKLLEAVENRARASGGGAARPENGS